MVCKVQLFEISHNYKHCCHAHSCGCLLGFTCERLTIRQVSECGTGSKSMAILTVPDIIRLFSKEFVLFPHPQPPQQVTRLPFLHILAVTRLVSLKLCYQLDGCELISHWCFIHVFLTTHEVDNLFLCLLTLQISSPENVFSLLLSVFLLGY